MAGGRRRRTGVAREHVAILYVRVSTGQQAESGLSLQHQEMTLRAAAMAGGFERTVLLREEGVSGKSMRNRPALIEALRMLEAGEASALYVSKMDRLARRTKDTLHVVDLADEQGWRFVALDVNLDTGTPVGRLVLTILAAVAEMERQRIAERHCDWHAAKRQRGEVWGLDLGPKSSIPSDVRARIVELREAGASLQGIADTLNAEGVPTPRNRKWHGSAIACVLRSPMTAALAIA